MACQDNIARDFLQLIKGILSVGTINLARRWSGRKALQITAHGSFNESHFPVEKSEIS